MKNWKKVVSVLAVISWMCMIFHYSDQPATESTKISDTVCYRIINTIDSWFSQGFTSAQKETYAEAITYPVRKVAHMTEYAVLAVLILNVLYQFSLFAHRSRYYLYAQAGTSLYAATDEFHQRFVPGRSGNLTDVGIDSVGAVIALLIVFCIIKQYKKRKSDSSSANLLAVTVVVLIGMFQRA